MSLDTLNNGDSGLEARTKLNAAVAAIIAEAATREAADTILQSDINGRAYTYHSHDLSQIRGSGATTGQVLTWSGASWAPATPAAAGAPPLPRGYLSGFKMTYNNSYLVDISAGVCRDSTDTENITMAAGITKNIGVNFSPGTGNGGCLPGISYGLPNIISVWVIYIPGFGTADVIFADSTSEIHGYSPYTKTRRIGWLYVSSLTAITPFTQQGDQVILNSGASSADLSITMTSNTDTPITLPAPPNTDVMMRVYASSTSGAFKIRLDPTSVTFPAAPTADTCTMAAPGGTVVSNNHLNLMTDASSKIHAMSSGGSNLVLKLTVRGWNDPRGRED